MIVTFLVLALRGTSLSAQHCPVPDSWAWEIAGIVTSHPAYAGLRAQAGVSGMEAQSPRLLTDTADAPVCDALLAKVLNPVLQSGGWAPALFEIAGFYVMIFYPLPVDEFRPRIVDGVMYGKLSHTPVAIFGRDMNLIADWFL